VSPRPDTADGAARRAVESWRDDQGRVIYPLPFPDLAVEPGVFVPTQGSYLLWKHLQRTGLGAGGTCLDVGCGCGILAVQLGLNGAAAVHAIDIDRGSVANTLANAFRNDVAGLVTGETIDLFQWEPTERFDVIAASLYQMPVDPYEEPSGHRPLDFWGRNLLDRFLALLPDLLAPGAPRDLVELCVDLLQIEPSWIPVLVAGDVAVSGHAVERGPLCRGHPTRGVHAETRLSRPPG
jgi:SAM-dependent methyltransferase